MTPDWQGLVERALSGLAVVDAGGCLVYTNARTVELTGAACAEELSGRRLDDVVSAEQREEVEGYLAQALIGRAVLGRPVLLARLDGWTLPVELSAVPATHGGHPAVQLELRDRTHTEADHRALQTSEDRSRALLGALTHGYAFAGMGGELLEVNDVLCDIVGYPRGQLIGTSPPYPFWIPDQAEAYGLAVATMLAAGPDGPDAAETEVPWRRGDGRVITAALSARVVLDAHGETLGYITLAQDVTARAQERAALAAMQQQLVEAQRQAKVGSWSWDIDTDTLTWSAQMYVIMGLPAAGGITVDRFLALLPAADRDPYLVAVGDVLRNGGETTVEHGVLRADGSVRQIVGTAKAERGPDTKRVVSTSGTAQDVTELRQHESDLAAGLAQLEAVAAASRAVLTDPDPRRAICQAAREVSGALAVTLLEVQGSRLVATASTGAAERIPLDRDLDDPASLLARVATSGQPVVVSDTGTHAVTDLPGAQAALCLPVLAAVRPGDAPGPAGSTGRVVGVLAVALAQAPHRGSMQLLNVLEILAGEAALAIDRADLHERLVRQAGSDGLTGLANRRTWDDRFPRELERARRTGRALSVAMIDLDDFKLYNDTHGHAAGDQLLRDVAQLWPPRLRATDVLARYGGEEFALAMPECDLPAAEALLGRLRDAMPAGTGASAGLARWDGAESGAELLARADRGLYAAKHAGKRRTGIVD